MPNPRTGDLCAACRFYDQQWISADGLQQWGYCRAHSPPALPAMNASRYTGAGAAISEWPRVLGADWCGEYAP